MVMVVYIKKYKFNDREYAIEDYEDGKPAKDHFFHDHYLSGRSKRFRLWVGGSGFGETDTLIEAETKLFNYALNETIYRKASAEQVVINCTNELKRLMKLIG